CLRRGLGSKVSISLGPPDMNKKITRLARAANGGGLTAKGSEALSDDEVVSARESCARSPAKPSMPKPLAKRLSICRRVRGTDSKDVSCKIIVDSVYINKLVGAQ